MTGPQGFLDSDAFAVHLTTPRPDGWQPHVPVARQASDGHIVRLDFETNGLKWWDGDKPVGFSYWWKASGRHGYVAFGHKGGGNIPEETAQRWCRENLPGCHLDNANTKFDIHQSRAWGVDLVKLGMTFGDVAHRAALLDDLRFTFGVDQLAKDFLGEDAGKYDLNIRDKGRLHELPAWAVEPYAIQDVALVDQLCTAMDPLLLAQDLGRVHQLEQDIIKVVVEMEMNGCYLDMDTLDQWVIDVKREYEDALFRIKRASGIVVDSVDSAKTAQRIFEARSIPLVYLPSGRPSFTQDIVKRAAANDPVIADFLYAGYLADLESKYIGKYSRTVRRSDGWIRFNLHQLRSGRDEHSNFGTVSGRFSSAGDDNGGFNVQQVVSPKKQKDKDWCKKFIVRNLFKPANGKRWLAVDADQIEYRIFAHYSNDEDVLARYVDPVGMPLAQMRELKLGRFTDYHDVVGEILKRAKPNITRKHTKITNFCKLFGASLIKFAWTLETISDAVFNELDEKYQIAKWQRAKRGEREAAIRQEPALAEAIEVFDAYDNQFPAAKRTLEQAKWTARDRGYVRTILGRRARFPRKQRLHSALNRAVQGTAADINKRVLVEVYNRREELGLTMRMTVHDEVDCDLADEGMMPKIEETFNTQYVPLKVPILWSAEVGPSWGEAKGKA